MGTFDALEAWREALAGAGVRAVNDSRAQYSSPAGYVLIPRPTAALRGVSCDDGGVRFLAGSLWAVCDGPESTASWQALDALVAIVGPVLGEYLADVNYSPEAYILATMGLDQPAVELAYQDLPARIY